MVHHLPKVRPKATKIEKRSRITVQTSTFGTAPYLIYLPKQRYCEHSSGKS